MSYNYLIGLSLCLLFIPSGLWFLYKKAVRNRSATLAMSLFCFLLGFLLLAIDIGLIVLLFGPGSIGDYLLFARSAGDANIAGRWIFTAYVFLTFGVLLSCFYSLHTQIKRLFPKFDKVIKSRFRKEPRQ